MDKKENKSLNEAYTGVPKEKIILKEAPYSKLGAWWDRTRSGRGDSPTGAGATGGAALGALAGGLPGAALGAIGGGLVGKAASLFSDPEASGMSELKDETNIVWDQFRRDVLSMNPRPKGKRILNWFKNELEINPDVIPSLKRNIDPKKRYGNDSKLQAIFRSALRDAQIYHYTGGLDKTSMFATDPDHLKNILMSLDEFAWNSLASKHASTGEDKKAVASVAMGGRPADEPQQTLDVLNFIFHKLDYMSDEVKKQVADKRGWEEMGAEVEASKAEIAELKSEIDNGLGRDSLPEGNDPDKWKAAVDRLNAAMKTKAKPPASQDLPGTIKPEDAEEYLLKPVVQMDLPLDIPDNKKAA